MATKKKNTATAEVEEKQTAEVAVVEEKVTAVGEVIDYGADYGDGSETDESEIVIPFLKILQAQSREIHPKVTIEGARAGLILNTATQELMESVHFVPAVRQRCFVEWIKAEGESTGTKGQTFMPNDPIVKDAIARHAAKEGEKDWKYGDYRTPDGNELAETFYLFGILADEEGEPTGMACIAFTSTQIKHWKKAIKNRMDAVTVPLANGRKAKPPIYAHQLMLNVGDETNGSNHWKGWVPKFFIEDNARKSLLRPDSPLYQSAKMLKEQVEAGEAKIDDNAEAAAKGAQAPVEEEAF